MGCVMAGTGDLLEDLRGAGFAFLRAPAMRGLLDSAGLRGWAAFAASWDDLGLDTYMADGGRYRKRRHQAFQVSDMLIAKKPRQPHYQSRDFNALNGGIARWFEPVTDAVADGDALPAILRLCHQVFDTLTPSPAWHVEVHQFRIEPQPGQDGRPTPEGLHQDGVDWVLVLLVRRENIASGETGIHGADRAALASFTLAEPADAAWLDDHRVFHGVTAVQPIDPGCPAFRDVLVVTFRRDDVPPV